MRTTGQSLDFVTLSIVLVCLKGCLCGEFEKQLYRKLLDGYEVLARPVKNDSHAVNVSLGLTLQQIIDIDEKNQIMQTNIWLTFQWDDYRLTWNPADYGGVEQLRLPPSLLWKPDVLLYNSVDESFDSKYPANVVIKSTGVIEWLPPGIVKSTCKIDITWFPFDERMVLKYGSWTYSGTFLDLNLGNVDNSTYMENGEWLLMDVLSTRNTFKYECCPEPYYDIQFTIWVRRRTLYYGFNFIIPCLLISLMTLLDFILPPESGEKLTLGITIFMSLCVFLLMVAEAMPPTSDAVPLIGTYFSCIMIVVSASQVLTVLVLNLHYRNPKTHIMSPNMRRIFLNWLPWLLLMHRPGYQRTKHGLIKIDEIPDMKRSRSTGSKSLLANILDIDDDLTPLSKSSSFYRSLVGGGSGAYRGTNNNLPTPDQPGSQCNADVVAITQPLINLLRDIFKDLRFVAKRMQQEDDEKTIIDDWKFAAMVLDRLSLIVFTTVLVVSTCAIIFAAPQIFV